MKIPGLEFFNNLYFNINSILQIKSDEIKYIYINYNIKNKFIYLFNIMHK